MKKVSKKSRIFGASFSVENFKLFILDSYDAQIYTEERSISVSKTY